jgi:hypothetical protein
VAGVYEFDVGEVSAGVVPPVEAELEEHPDVAVADGAVRGGVVGAIAAQGSTASATASKTDGA